jgi:hypothetical protein
MASRIFLSGDQRQRILADRAAIAASLDVLALAQKAFEAAVDLDNADGLNEVQLPCTLVGEPLETCKRVLRNHSYVIYESVPGLTLAVGLAPRPAASLPCYKCKKATTLVDPFHGLAFCQEHQCPKPLPHPIHSSFTAFDRGWPFCQQAAVPAPVPPPQENPPAAAIAVPVPMTTLVVTPTPRKRGRPPKSLTSDESATPEKKRSRYATCPTCGVQLRSGRPHPSPCTKAVTIIPCTTIGQVVIE